MGLKKITFISVVILILFTGIASAVDNSTQNDSITTLNQNYPIINDNGTFDEIQNAVDNSNNGDIIELEGYFSTAKNAIKINKNLTIVSSSNQAILDGKKISSIFEINGNLILKGLVIKNSNKSALKLNFSNKLTVINCSFLYNGGNECIYGGVLDSSGYFTIINSTFIKNTAKHGSAIHCFNSDVSNIINSKFINHTGHAIKSTGSINISDCLFENNGANNSQGGAIYTTGNLNISNSKFINNSASMGGAIYVFWSNLSINNSLFDNNVAHDSGGDIAFISTLKWGGEIFSDIIISNSNFTDSKACHGGAIYANFSNLYLTNTHIKALSNCEDIYLDIGNFINDNSSYDDIKWILNHTAILSADKLTTTYDSEDEFIIQLFDNNTTVRETYINVKVFTGKKSKEYNLVLNYDGIDIAVLRITGEFGVGKHKVEITSQCRYYDVEKLTTYITIKKAKTIVKIDKYKLKSKKLKITLSNQRNYKKLAKIKLKIKVIRKNKSKIYNVKTSKNGVCTIKLKRGVYKVIISSKNRNYLISKKSKIKIK